MFQTVNYLLHEKNKDYLDPDLINNFSSFITRKTFSFYNSGQFVGYINDALNLKHITFPSPEDEFRYYDNMIPKLKFRKSEYIKKNKKEKQKKETVSNIPEFYTEREFKILGLLD